MSSWSRAATAATLAATLGGWGLAALAPRDFIVGTFQDDAQYAVLAKAIRVEHAYRALEFPGHPPELKFAPGWPAVLALAWRPGASDTANLERLRWVNLIVAGPLAGVITAAGVTAFGLAPALSALAALAGVATPVVMMWWTIPLSEPLCLAFLALTVALAAAERPKGAAAAGAIAVYVRSIAAPFLVALVAVQWWKRGWRAAVGPAAIGFGLLVPWALWVAIHTRDVPPVLQYAGFGTYAAFYGLGLRADPATMVFTVPYVNAPMVLQALGQALLGWHWAPWPLEMALGLGVVALAAVGARSRPVLDVGLGLYLFTVLFWPFPQADRFVGSVWPLVLLAALAALGGDRASRAKNGRDTGSPGAVAADAGPDRAGGAKKAGVAHAASSGTALAAPPFARARWALAALAAVTAAVAFWRGEGVKMHEQRSRSYVALLDSIRPRLPPGALVATDNPPLVYLRLGNPTIVNWRERSYRWYREGFWAAAWGLGDDLWDIVRAYRPDYLVIGRGGAEGRYAAGSLMRQCPGSLRELWATPGGEYLFAVHPDVPCTPVRRAR